MIDFEVSRREFLLALQNVGNAVRDNKTIPSIAGIYLDVKEGSVEIKGTDLEMSISATLKAKVNSPGITVIKVNTLQEYLREISDETIRIEEDRNEICISTKSSTSGYTILNYSDYPDTFSFVPNFSCSIDADNFAEGIEKTIIGAAATPDNLAVHAVRLDIEKDSIKIVTSDTYRLMYYNRAKIIDFQNSVKASIPLKTANSIVKIIRSIGPKTIKIASSQSLIYFEIGSVKVLSKLIDLPYPDYESIFSSIDFNKEVLCDSSELMHVLKRVHIFAKNNSDVRNGAKFNFRENKLLIDAISDQARVKEDIAVVKKGDDLSISLNVKFVIDFIQQISKSVVLKLKDENSAVMLTSDEDVDLICITMPLSLD